MRRVRNTGCALLSFIPEQSVDPLSRGGQDKKNRRLARAGSSWKFVQLPAVLFVAPDVESKLHDAIQGLVAKAHLREELARRIGLLVAEKPEDKVLMHLERMYAKERLERLEGTGVDVDRARKGLLEDCHVCPSSHGEVVLRNAVDVDRDVDYLAVHAGQGWTTAATGACRQGSRTSKFAGEGRRGGPPVRTIFGVGAPQEALEIVRLVDFQVDSKLALGLGAGAGHGRCSLVAGACFQQNLSGLVLIRTSLCQTSWSSKKNLKTLKKDSKD